MLTDLKTYTESLKIGKLGEKTTTTTQPEDNST
jgi:hypothetical protein